MVSKMPSMAWATLIWLLHKRWNCNLQAAPAEGKVNRKNSGTTPVCTMGIQGYCMAIALLQTKSRIVSLAAQVDMNLLKENLGFDFATLKGCKGLMNISSSLPGLRCCLAGGTGEREVVSCGQHCSHTLLLPSNLLSLMRMKGVQRKTQYEQSHTPPLLGPSHQRARWK